MEMTTENAQGMIRLFKHRWETMWGFYVDSEEQIDEQWRERLDSLDRDAEHSNDELRQRVSAIDWRCRTILREAILIQTCAFVEYTLKTISRMYIPDYEARVPNGRGNWRRHLNLLVEIANIQFNEEDIEMFQHFWKLRNCIVHVGGHLEEDGNSEAIRETIQKLQAYGKEPNLDMAGESNDGYVLLGSNFISEVILTGEKIIEIAFAGTC